jgi:hypothetical protein
MDVLDDDDEQEEEEADSYCAEEEALSDDALLAACIDSVDPIGPALYGVEYLMRQTGLCRSRLHAKLQSEEPLLRLDQGIHGHFDGGSMATTTDKLDLLWHVEQVSRPPALKVADDYAHYPTHRGYLRVPTSGDYGYEMVPSFYTPTLQATIISPDNMGQKLGCSGYLTMSNFDGTDCRITLRHCRRTNGDVDIDLIRVRGLLFSRPLIAPTTEAERTGPMPRTKLHVHCLTGPSSMEPIEVAASSTDEAPACSSNACACSSCDSPTTSDPTI